MSVGRLIRCYSTARLLSLLNFLRDVEAQLLWRSLLEQPQERQVTHNPDVLRQSAAQAGIGTPPKVSDKVLNTSGYKGCNPLNVKVFGNKWKGLIGQDERGHAIFARPEDGIRAGVKVIQTYANKYGLNTIESILSRFAAADSMTMGAYVDNVSHATGYAPTSD